jgi:phosphinothricin acetyltransferase
MNGSDRRGSAGVRPARPDDAAAIARIYTEGIDDRVATFETAHRSAAEVEDWFGGAARIVVAELDGEVVAWASATPYSSRACYAGVREFSIYVARASRGAGHGRAALAALIADCEARGDWKLLSRIFPENEASLALCRTLGFRQVGVYKRHAKLDGCWRDVVAVERLLGEAREATPAA